MSEITYSIASDTANGLMNSPRLHEEMLAGSFSVQFDSIHHQSGSDSFDVVFNGTHSAADETAADAIVAAHSGADPVELIPSVKVVPSDVPTSLRLEGLSFSAPPNTTTTYNYKLPDNYRIRGAEFQINNASRGTTPDIIKVWVTDVDGAVYPAGTRLTQYVPNMHVYKHEPGTYAQVLDLVDDDTSDEVPSVFYLEFEYTNNQPAGNDDVLFIANFWMYVEGQS